jgi:hypothetical protein
VYKSQDLAAEEVERVGFESSRLEGEGELVLANGDRVRGVVCC